MSLRHLVGVIQPGGDDDRSMYACRGRPCMDYNFTASDDMEVSGSPGPAVWHTMAFILLSFFIMILALVIKDGGFCRCFGYQFGCPFLGLPHSSQHPLAGTGELFDQRRLTPQDREDMLKKHRQERRLWYSYYLKPFLTVLSEKEFRRDDKQETQDHEEEEAKGDEETSTPKEEADPKPEVRHTTIVDVDELHDKPQHKPNPPDLESGQHAVGSDGVATTDQDGSFVACKSLDALSLDDEELPRKMMTIWDPHDTTFRTLEAECTICLLQYEPGDTIVRSAANEEEEFCIHVFHLECMLQWLSQGKKRCPVCRHWFVPGVRIKEQMNEANIVSRDSLHHLYDARTMEDVASLSGDTDSDMSRSFNTDGVDGMERGQATFISESPTSNDSTETLSDNVLALPESSQPPTSSRSWNHHHHRHHRRHTHPTANGPNQSSSHQEGRHRTTHATSHHRSFSHREDRGISTETYQGLHAQVGVPSPWLQMPTHFQFGYA